MDLKYILRIFLSLSLGIIIAKFFYNSFSDNIILIRL